MALKTRGSAALDKAQRRLASLKSISEDLDLAHGLTNQVYQQQIETTRAALEAYNTLVSLLDESRKTVAEHEKTLNALSARMLTAVAVKYGRDSKQYSKAGGSIARGRTTSPAQSSPNPAPEQVSTLLSPRAANGAAEAGRPANILR